MRERKFPMSQRKPIVTIHCREPGCKHKRVCRVTVKGDLDYRFVGNGTLWYNRGKDGTYKFGVVTWSCLNHSERHKVTLCDTIGYCVYASRANLAIVSGNGMKAYRRNRAKLKSNPSAPKFKIFRFVSSLSR